MTAGHSDDVSTDSLHVRRLATTDEQALRRLCRLDSVANCFAHSRIDASLRPNAPTYFLGSFTEDGELRGAIYVGANLVPVGTDDDDRRAIAAALDALTARAASLTGPRDAVLGFWSLLESRWGVPREVREDQPVLVIDQQPSVAPLAQLRPVMPHEIEDFLPACVAMFTEEVGVSPLANGMAAAYHARVSETIRAGRALAFIEDGVVVFKAEIGSVADGVCQIQGVWVHPDWRGRGVATAGMAAVVQHAREKFAPVVSLYVNHYNEAARKAYSRVGFRQHTTFATIHR